MDSANITSVSYTHLTPSSSSNCLSCIDKGGCAMCKTLAALEIVPSSTIAVSYTHLDVYKRQL